MMAKVIFVAVGIWCIMIGLVGALLVVAMFQHPGGIGAEKLLGPVIGLFALGFFFGGGVCLCVARRLGELHKSAQP